MSDRPLPTPDSERDPPAVELLRERLRGSRIGALARRYKTLAAVAAGALAVIKAWRWLAFDLWRVATHPGWVVRHWELVLAGSAALFLVVFVAARLGIDWLGGHGDDAEVDPRNADEQLQRARDAATMRR